MTTIKSHTDLPQSKKLAEILPLESADMFYAYGARTPDIMIGSKKDYRCYTMCWSLAALLNVLNHPRCFQGDKPEYWFCGCFAKDNLYHEVEADNPVDACYEMILKLHERKML